MRFKSLSGWRHVQSSTSFALLHCTEHLAQVGVCCQPCECLHHPSLHPAYAGGGTASRTSTTLRRCWRRRARTWRATARATWSTRTGRGAGHTPGLTPCGKSALPGALCCAQCCACAIWLRRVFGQQSDLGSAAGLPGLQTAPVQRSGALCQPPQLDSHACAGYACCGCQAATASTLTPSGGPLASSPSILPGTDDRNLS